MLLLGVALLLVGLIMAVWVVWGTRPYSHQHWPTLLGMSSRMETFIGFWCCTLGPWLIFMGLWLIFGRVHAHGML